MLDRGRLESFTYAALRIVSGVLFAFHGAQKLFGLFAKKPGPEMFTQMWVGGVIELVAGLFIAFGLFTRPAALLASGTMAVAYIQFHWKGALDSAFFPLVNGGELAILYCFVFLLFCVKGAGAASIDRLLGRA
ncbi:MAG: DoxX family protein [Deltaproteobacteria bacterium]|nr:DoxX family protein [Deltaproteobacteria bacterium]